MPRSLALLLLIAVGVKAIYFTQYLSLPILDGPVFDSLVYLRQAASVRDGRFGDASLLGFAPLYGYVLAATGAPSTLLTIVLLQLLLGCVNLVLVYQITERLFDRRAAIVSSALYLGYGLLVFYETKVLAEVLGISLSLLALSLCTRRPFIVGELPAATLAGSVTALAALARPNVLVTMPLLGFALLAPWDVLRDSIQADRPWRIRARRTLGWLLGIAVTLGASGTWNYRNTGFFVPVLSGRTTSERASQTAWTGDLSVFSTRDNGDVGAFDMIDRAQARLDGRVPDAPKDTTIDPFGVLANAPVKALATVRNTETGFMYGYYGERSELWALGLFSVSFGVLGVLGLVGVVATVASRRWRALIPLLPWALAAFASTILFHPDNRYRLPLVLALLVSAGVGVVWLWDRRRDRRSWLLSAPVLLACVYFTHATVTYELNDPAMWQLRMAESALSASDHEEAERRINRALALGGDKPHIQHRIAYLRARF